MQKSPKMLAALLVLVFMLSLGLAGCAGGGADTPPENDASAVTPNATDAPSGKYMPGSYTATTLGYGGIVTVTVTVAKDGSFTVAAEGPDETPDRGGKAVEQLPGRITDAQNAEIDGISGATVTSAAIKTAFAACLAQAAGETVSSAMKAGTYTASAYGHYTGCPLTVEVTVSENAITDIRIADPGQETEPILASVVDKLIPRMLENNSLAIDAVTGATESSAAVKLAATDCVLQALTAAGNSAAGLAAYQSVPEKSAKTVALTYDVVVVGLGGSGTAAAVRAAQVQQEAGREVSVLGIDKAGKYGGTIAVTAEMLAVNPEGYMAEFNGGQPYVDKEAMLDAWMTYTEGDAKEELVRLDLDHSGAALDWMRSLGWEFASPVTGFGPEDIWVTKFMYAPNNNYGNRVQIAAYFDKMFDTYKALGGEYMLEAEGQSLIYDEATDTVTGVNAVGHDGTRYVINAKAVVLATGGFGENGEMTEKYLTNDHYPLKGEWAIHGLGTNDGKMIAAALEIDAGTYNIDNPPVVHLAGPERFYTQFEKITSDNINFFTGKPTIWSQGDITLALCVAPNALAVTTEGVRYTNEYMLDHFDTWKAGPYYYTIWSDTELNEMMENGLSWVADGPCFGWLGCQSPIPAGYPLTQMYDVVSAAIADGMMWEADSIGELAGLIGVDAAALADTVSTYNRYVDQGVDAEYGKDAKYLDMKVEGQKYYAIKAVSYCYTIGGGLDVNTDLQVLNTAGVPINGLFAAGTDSECALYSPRKAYVTYGGSAAGWAWTSGYLSGANAAEYVAAQE